MAEYNTNPYQTNPIPTNQPYFANNNHPMNNATNIQHI